LGEKGEWHTIDGLFPMLFPSGCIAAGMPQYLSYQITGVSPNRYYDFEISVASGSIRTEGDSDVTPAPSDPTTVLHVGVRISEQFPQLFAYSYLLVNDSIRLSGSSDIQLQDGSGNTLLALPNTLSTVGTYLLINNSDSSLIASSLCLPSSGLIPDFDKLEIKE
jgi:hypothetical protein